MRRGRPGRPGIKFDPDKRVLGLWGVRRHRPYILIKDGKRLDVLCMNNPHRRSHPDSSVGRLWCVDMVDTKGKHHHLKLFLFGLCPRPSGGRAVTDYNVLLQSDRVVSNQELGEAECIHWEHSRTYKMQQAAAIAQLFLQHDKVLGVSLYGSLARGENGADYDMVIHTCPSLAWKNLYRAKDQGRGVCFLKSHRRVNPDLTRLLELSEDQRNKLLELIATLKLDLQILPQPMSPAFRKQFLSGHKEGSNGRFTGGDFLTRIEADFVRFDPTSGTFRAKKTAP